MGKSLLNLCENLLNLSHKFNNVFPILLLSPPPPLGSGRRAKWSMHEQIRCFFLWFPQCSWAILDLNPRPHLWKKFSHLHYYSVGRKSIEYINLKEQFILPEHIIQLFVVLHFSSVFVSFPFPHYVNGKFLEENFDGKRKKGVTRPS
jgi:hypothetical protein